MHLAVLGATGATGRQLVRQALDRGHTVTALARHLQRLDLPSGPRLRPVAADVADPSSIAAALSQADVLLSGLGVSKGGSPGTLTSGARAVVAAAPGRIIWLGAFGTGGSAQAAGALTRSVLRAALGQEIPDKVAADNAVLAAGGLVFHAGPLTNGGLAEHRRTVSLAEAPRRWVTRPISRATVAAAMLDEAQNPGRPSQILIPLSP